MEKKKIVLAEDNFGVRRGLVWNIKDLGYEVAAAEDGVTALDLIKEFKPDLLISDFEMPGMNGVELINALGKKGYDLPVIIYSYGLEKINKEAIKYKGIVKFADKGLPLSMFLNKIKSILD